MVGVRAGACLARHGPSTLRCARIALPASQLPATGRQGLRQGSARTVRTWGRGMHVRAGRRRKTSRRGTRASRGGEASGGCGRTRTTRCWSCPSRGSRGPAACARRRRNASCQVRALLLCTRLVPSTGSLSSEIHACCGVSSIGVLLWRTSVDARRPWDCVTSLIAPW